MLAWDACFLRVGAAQAYTFGWRKVDRHYYTRNTLYTVHYKLTVLIIVIIQFFEFCC